MSATAKKTLRYTLGPWELAYGAVFGNHMVICDPRGSNPEQRESNVALIVAAPEMYEALKAYERLDEFHANCEECAERPEYAPEACSECFPLADDARLKMRAAIEKVERST